MAVVLTENVCAMQDGRVTLVQQVCVTPHVLSLVGCVTATPTATQCASVKTLSLGLIVRLSFAVTSAATVVSASTTNVSATMAGLD